MHLSADILGLCKLYIIQIMEEYINMYQAIQNCIDIVNANGGFNVTGWCKRGMINDKTLIAARNLTGNSDSAPVNNYNNN